MERLTKTYADKTHGAANNLPCGENSHTYKALLLHALGRYEDTGIEPEEIELMKKILQGKCYACKNAKEYELAPNSRTLKTCDYMASCASTGKDDCEHWELLVGENDGGWIPVSEKLPDEKENPKNGDFYEYQVTAKFGAVADIRHYKFGRGKWWNSGSDVTDCVIAWQPLPEPYRSQE